MYGELKEEKIYIECPSKNRHVEKDVSIILEKNICSLIAARQYKKDAVKILKNVGFAGGNVD